MAKDKGKKSVAQKAMKPIDFSRHIHFAKEVNFESMKELQKELADLCVKSPTGLITLQLMCTGGNCAGGFGLYDIVMKVLKPNLQTLCSGHVGSMAVPLFLMGDTRVILPHSRIYLHELGTTPKKEARMGTTEVQLSAAVLQIQTEWYVDIIHKRIGKAMSKEKIRSMMYNEAFLTAEEAVNLGFAHQIL